MPLSIGSNTMDEEAERMDLVLNSDLCSVLLDCWDDTTAKNEKGNGGSSTGSGTPSDSDRNRLWENVSDGNPAGDLNNFLMEDFSGAQKSFPNIQPASSSPTMASLSNDVQQKSGTANETSGVDTSSQPRSQLNPPMASQNLQQPHNSSRPGAEDSAAPTKLHPQGITSSADCPPHIAALNAASSILPLAFGTANITANNSMGAQQPAILPAQFSTMLNTKVTNSVPQAKPAPANSKGDNTIAQQNANPPPFLLFDAPMELRANFIQSQRAHGLPVLQDNNSYHYGMAATGFHPANLRLIDARHGDTGNKRAKNAKEQKRAQQITKLIDQLRVKMEKDGWKVELKSKFHTLSSCADYVRHLVKTNKEKEEAIEKAKLDLEAKKRQLQEDKAQQDPSDPESTTSDLTESSGSAGASSKVCKAEQSTDAGDTSGEGSGGDSKEDHQKRLMVSRDSTVSSASGEDRGELRTVLADQTSSVSDVTDSNKEGSMNGSSSGKGNHDSLGSVCSDAAVASGTSNDNTHSGVVIQGGKRKSRSAKTHTKGVTSFDLDYQEVFVKSNVPQLLATPSGRVVAWNDFFLRVSGLASKEVRQLTIFSLVKSQNLAKLFDIVAAALRTGSLKSENSDTDISGREEVDRKWDYDAITLPCVRFPREVADGTENRQVFMTVTLMTDKDPRKRCFHCVFTDDPGTKGSLGSITPELLSSLFGKPDSDSKFEESRKKRKIQK